MKVNVITIILLLLLLVYVRVHSFGQASTTTSEIRVPDNYPTIQAAIDAAKEGETVIVNPGTYNEHVKITKSLKLLGSGRKSVIVGNGVGHTIEILRGVTNVTLAGFAVKGSRWPLLAGIYIGGIDNTVKENLITDHYYGVFMWDSSGNTLRNNNLTSNRYNLEVWGLTLSHFLHDIDDSNTVDGKPVYYWINKQAGQVPNDAGYVAIVNSTNITMKDLTLSNNGQGLLLAYATNLVVQNVTCFNNIRGIHMVLSNNNILVENNVSKNAESGFLLVTSSNNDIHGNNVTYNKWGIHLSYSPLLLARGQENIIRDNKVTNNYEAIVLSASENNRISGNKIIKNEHYGLMLGFSSDNNIVLENIIMSNKYGIWIDSSSHNFICHNNFVNNTIHAGISAYESSTNVWDDGYPSGGNYWGDYTGADLKSGQSQDHVGGDGIGDIPYVISDNNQDKYPLVSACRKLLSILTLSAPQNAIVGWAINISARLVDEELNPIPEATINFYLDEDYFLKWIGSSSTNLNGIATIDHELPNSGKFQIRAEYLGNQVYGNVTATQQLIVTEDRSYIVVAWVLTLTSVIVIIGVLKWKMKKKNKDKKGHNSL